MNESRVYAVASGKGGVGKTTTAAAIGACAAAAGRSTVVVDADLGMGNLASAVGLAGVAPTLHDVLAGDADLADATHESAAGFDVVPGAAALEDYADADPAGLGDVVAELRERYDVVVLDTGAGLSHDTVLPLGLADAVLLVTTPAAMALENTRTTAAVADRLGAAVRGVVVTHATDDAAGVAESLEAPLLGAIPADEAVHRAADAGEPVTVFDPDSLAARAYAGLVADLLDVPAVSLGPAGEGEADAEAAAAVAGGAGGALEDDPDAGEDGAGPGPEGDAEESPDASDSGPDAEAADGPEAVEEDGGAEADVGDEAEAAGDGAGGSGADDASGDDEAADGGRTEDAGDGGDAADGGAGESAGDGDDGTGSRSVLSRLTGGLIG